MLGLANTFSGGVFLAIAFVHIIPETASLYYEYKYAKSVGGEMSSNSTTSYQLLVSRLHETALSGNSTEGEVNRIVSEYLEKSFSQFPLPFVLVLCGYSIILLIDKVIIDAHSHSHGHGHAHTQAKHNEI